MRGAFTHRHDEKASVLLLCACLLLAGCGTQAPSSVERAELRLAADGTVTLLVPGERDTSLHLPPDAPAAREAARRALRLAITPWVKAQGRSDDFDASSNALLHVRFAAGARWRDVQVLLYTAASHDLGVWRFTVGLLGAAAGTPFLVERAPALTDTGPLLPSGGLLPVEYRAVCVSVGRTVSAGDQRRTRLLLDERTWMEAPQSGTEFSLPAFASEGAAHAEVVARACDRLRTRVAATKPDAIGFFADDTASDLSAGEMLAIYKAVYGAAQLDLLHGDPSR